MGIEPIRERLSHTSVLKTARHTSYLFTSKFTTIISNHRPKFKHYHINPARGVYLARQAVGRINALLGTGARLRARQTPPYGGVYTFNKFLYANSGYLNVYSRRAVVSLKIAGLFGAYKTDTMTRRPSCEE